jgi:hypothetical protein
MAEHSITGRWRGHYQYRKSPDDGCSFTASITESCGLIEGIVEDDSWTGEASILGSFSFPSVQFTKVYLNVDMVKHVEKRSDRTIMTVRTNSEPIHYEGTMTADGKTLNGTWKITGENVKVDGTWTAYRLEEKEKNKIKEKVKGVEEEQLQEQLVEVG